MYSWGGDTSNWRGSSRYDFDQKNRTTLDDFAKKSAARGPRSYEFDNAPGKIVDPRGKTISSKSQNPIVVGVDVTGSMSTWPAEIFDRLPLVYQTLSQYREGLEISFSAIGDAYADDYPLQVNDFGKGLKLEEHIKALYPEGGGGGSGEESYDLWGYFMLEHCKVPEAIDKPFLFLFGDEGFYDQVHPKQVQQYIGDTIERSDTHHLFRKLAEKYDFYLLHKPYGGWNKSDEYIVKQWAGAIGQEHIKVLPSQERAVDVMMGIVAKKWNQYSNFQENLSARQSSNEVKDSVYRAVEDQPTTGVKDTSSRGAGDDIGSLYDAAKR